MLDQTTKKKIDSARQILVGKIPNPISQVDQITNALIYKFMDDMDNQNIAVDMEAQYFTGDYAKYSWTKLMSKQLTGLEKLDLYRQATENMSKNKKIPQLFRDIFKDAYLPYNDHRVLSLFLKEINEFSYENSENLGDAFEYLLSILGSQGDAGQFRTPRHIIDFIVEAIAPKKNESILDPACGTAGFLISAYKHIIKENEKNPLTPEEKKKLSQKIVGYDIDDSMIKLALVNMYLHGFSNPLIHSYDTLSDDKRWGENFDVILANPPFMTPKGGIEPHKKFSVQANRSEVLFVDYIIEHLSLKGHAGIIVPEGIVFKSDKAYKELRENLVEDGLFAVVSLPAGVFKPYSGVKTSILFFDNQIAKNTNEILFVKVANDGFDLGAQRREIEQNDLPEALEILSDWKKSKKRKSELALWVKKEKIAENGDYNLIGERYREAKIYKNQKWQLVELGDVCEIYNGSTPLRSNKSYWENGKIPWFTIDDIRNQGRIIKTTTQTITQKAFEKTSVKLLPPKTILLCCAASVGEYAITEIEVTTNQQFNGLVIRDEYKEKLNQYFLFHLSRNFEQELIRLSGKTSFNFVPIQTLKKIKIPLPPLEVQKDIVAQIETKQNAINHAQEIIKNLEQERGYFGKELSKLENIKWVELGDVCEYEQPTKYIVESVNYDNSFKTPVLTAGKTFILGYTNEIKGIMPAKKLPVIIFDDFTTAIKFVDFPFKIKSSAMKILHIDKTKVVPRYLFEIMKTIKFRHSEHKRYWISEFSKIKISLPPLAVQKKLVAEVEKETEIIAANQRLIELMQAKIEKVLSEI